MINIKRYKKIFRIITITFLMALFPISIYSNNAITIDQTFTKEQGLWYPGRLESKDFYINNNKDKDIQVDRLYISLKSSRNWKTNEELDINSNQFKELAKNSTVTLTHNGEVLFRDRLKDLLSTEGISLSNQIYIKANDRELLNMTIDMDLEMNNSAQALDNVFNIGVKYIMDEDKVPPVNPEEPSNPDVDDIEKPSKPVNPGTNIDGSQSGKLPQTGGIINGTSLIFLGTVAIGTGFALNKRSKEKGGKHHE